MYQAPVPAEQQLPAPPSGSGPAASPYSRPPAQPYGTQQGPTPSPYNPYPASPPRYAPPYYVYEPLPPPPLRHRAPASALWLGIRGGALFPSGGAYEEDTGQTDQYGFPIRGVERWSDLAGTGPMLEVDVGARFSRHYVLYGLWERGWLSPSTYPSPEVPGRGTSATTDFAGVGFRWSSNPDTVGLVADLALGYRWFRESWSDGTKLDLQGFGETRLGIGADIRVSNRLSLSPMFALSVGSFSERNLRSPLGSGEFGYSTAHNTITLTLGAHYDVVP